jgi:hypothetical protein
VENDRCLFVFNFCRHLVLNVFPFLLTLSEFISHWPVGYGWWVKCLLHLFSLLLFYVCNAIILADLPTMWGYFVFVIKLRHTCSQSAGVLLDY